MTETEPNTRTLDLFLSNTRLEAASLQILRLLKLEPNHLGFVNGSGVNDHLERPPSRNSPVEQVQISVLFCQGRPAHHGYAAARVLRCESGQYVPGVAGGAGDDHLVAAGGRPGSSGAIDNAEMERPVV